MYGRLVAAVISYGFALSNVESIDVDTLIFHPLAYGFGWLVSEMILQAIREARQ